MNPTSRSPGIRRRTWLALPAMGLALPHLAMAQSRTVRMQVGFPPGGSTDVVARLVAAPYRGRDGEVAIVENVPGAAGRLAMMRVKAAAPDGQTVLVSPAAMFTLYPHVYRALAYDPFKDFTPVTSIGSVGFALVVSTTVVPESVRTLADLGAWIKAHPQHAN